MMQSQQPAANGGFGGEEPLGPADSLALIERETGRARRSLGTTPAPFMVCWGTGMLLIFTGFYLAVPGGPRFLPMSAAMVTLAVVLVGAITFSAVYGARSGRGVRGDSRVAGAMYGISWPLSFCVLGVVNWRLGAEFALNETQNSLLWSTSSMLLVGAMYLISGAVWRSTTMYALGALALLGAACSVFVGVPGNLLVVGLAFGGGLLLSAPYAARSARCAA